MLKQIILTLLLTFGTSLALADDTASNKKQENDTSTHAELERIMDASHGKMDSMPSMGDPDMDFVQMMTEHHKTGIEMAKVALEKGDDPQVKEIAKKMIQEQSRDIAKFDAWMKKAHR